MWKRKLLSSTFHPIITAIHPLHPRCPFLENSSNIYPSFIKIFHLLMIFLHPCFSFMQHSSFICQASMCQSSIFHPKFKFVYLACHSCSHVHCSCSSIHLIMFMEIYLKLHKILLFDEIKFSQFCNFLDLILLINIQMFTWQDITMNQD